MQSAEEVAGHHLHCLGFPFRVLGLGFGFGVLGFGVLGFRVLGLGLWVSGFWGLGLM